MRMLSFGISHFFVPLGTYGIPCSYAQNAGLSGLLRMLASQAATSPTRPKADCSIALCRVVLLTSRRNGLVCVSGWHFACAGI